MVHTSMDGGEKRRSKNKKQGKRHVKLSRENPSLNERNKKSKKEKPRKGHHNLPKDCHSKTQSHMAHKDMEVKKCSNQSMPQASILRKRVDPETTKYFTEIANLFESNAVDLEERSTVCGNALEETRGKELELATDSIISRNLQSLLEGCDLDHLCGFLRSCAKVFPSIAIDRFGSHVAEMALKCLAMHLQDGESHYIIEDTLTKICQVVVLEPVNLMCSCYGSHVLRSLLCLCKGVPLDSLEEFHVTKPSALLAERLNSKPAQSEGNVSNNFQHGFPVVFSYCVREMLNHAKDDITILRMDKFSSFVLQTCLKLSMGDDQVLLHAIGVLLGCEEDDAAQGKFIGALTKKDIMNLLEDTASSHLLEVIIEVAPEALYNYFLSDMFKESLFEISLHQCGNFVVQALISSARSSDQVHVIWEKLGPKLKKLLEHGKSGVVASLLASCQRLQTHTYECCEAIARAVSSESEYPNCIVPHLLFLERYVKENSHWEWPVGDKMHTLGCLMLQTIFKFSHDIIQPYITSMESMEADHMFQTAKDAGGGRVLEAFLCSDASAKQKLKVIAILQDHFGELSMHPSGSFTVEKCFMFSNVTLKEAIAAELLVVQPELSKTKHGPHLLKKLDINGYATRPDQWKRSQASKEALYREFRATFGFNKKPKEQNVNTLQPSTENPKKHNRRQKKTSRDYDVPDAPNAAPSLGSQFAGVEISMAKFGFPMKNKSSKKESSSYEMASMEFDGKESTQNCTKTSFPKGPGRRKASVVELADLAAKSELSEAEIRELFKPAIKNEKERSGNEKMLLFKKHKR